jgi:hypothetical protein
MTINTIRKEIIANEEFLNIIIELNGVGSVTFLADLPKNAIVTGLFVNGKSLANYRLEASRNDGRKDEIHYPRNGIFEGHNVAAVYVDESCGGELYGLATSGDIKSFVVEYIETAIVEM